MSFLFSLIHNFRSCFFFFFSFCMSCTSIISLQLFLFWLTPTEIVVLSFFLSFFLSLVLPVAWAVDLAVQGCKYHCRFFHPCPLTFTDTHIRSCTPHCVQRVRLCAHFELPGTVLHERFHTIVPSHQSYIPLCAGNLLMPSTRFSVVAIRQSQSVVFRAWQHLAVRLWISGGSHFDPCFDNFC